MSRSSQAKPLTAAEVSTGDPSAPQSSRMFVERGLLSNLEVGFEWGGTIHLAPHLTREPSEAEAAQLETVLNEAVDDLYSRPALRP